MAKNYDTPTLTIIYNNRGWHSPKVSNDLVHHEGGLAGSRDSYWITVGAGARLADVAKAMGGAETFELNDAGEIDSILQQALAVVRGGQSAVVDVKLEPISQQTLGRRVKG